MSSLPSSAATSLPSSVPPLVLSPSPSPSPSLPPLLSLPPEGVFDSFEALESVCQAHAKSAGYAFTTHKSERRKGRWIKTLICKRGREYRSHNKEFDEDSRLRARETFKIKCPVIINAKEKVNGSWHLTHRKEHSTHNHEPSGVGAFPEHRRLNQDQKDTIKTHYTAGITTNHTATVLRDTDPSVTILKRDIYNITASIVRASRKGQSPPEALIAQLEAEKTRGETFFQWRQDEGGHIGMLFVADMRSIEYLNKHPDILLLDCTYKTNKFDMPLLDILGVDHHGSSFTIALCWLDQETEENYDEAIQHLVSLFRPSIWPSVVATDCELALIKAIERYFPAIHTKRVLCYWHIAKNIMANCKALFPTIERWEDFERECRNIVFAKSEDEYEDILQEFKVEFSYNDGIPHRALASTTSKEQQDTIDRDLERQAAVYVIGQWLTPYKELIIHAWTDRFFHGGTTTTSRLEGAHAVLKGWIGKPTKHLTQVWTSSKLAINDQLNEIIVKQRRRLQSTPIGLEGPFYHPIISKISHAGLRLLQKQRTIALRPPKDAQECSGLFRTSMGMPCWHMIQRCIERYEGIYMPLDFEDILLIK
jgi:hypothetical protein